MLQGAVENVVFWRIAEAGSQAMCSGCSGQFDDGEDRERDEDSVEDQDTGRARSSDDGGQPGAGGFACGHGPVEGAEDYEVLVTEEKIIERRIVLAKSCFISEEKAGGPAAR